MAPTMEQVLEVMAAFMALEGSPHATVPDKTLATCRELHDNLSTTYWTKKAKAALTGLTQLGITIP